MTPGETEETVLSVTSFERDRQVELPPCHYALVFER
jgi:hypothetical protein